MKTTIQTTLFALLFLFQFSLKAQTISGIVIDSETQNPIPNASVTLGKRGIITDSKGKFTLHYKETDWELNTAIRITCVGFHTYSKGIKSFPNQEKIFLTPQTKELMEVIVSSSALEIVKKAILAVPKNYSQKNFVATGKFFETNRRTKTDTVFTLDYEAKTQMSYNVDRVSNSTVKLISYKKTKFKTADSTKYITFANDGKIIELMDIVYANKYFFQLNKLKNYQFLLQDIKDIQGRSTYIIKFQLKKDPTRQQGHIYIDEETFAITAIEYEDSNLSNSHISQSGNNQNRFYKGKMSYKNINDNWYLDNLELSLSAQIKQTPAYVSINYQLTDIDTNDAPLQVSFNNKLTNHIVMENLDKEFDTLKISGTSHPKTNIENLGFLWLGKKIRYSAKSLFSLNTTAMQPRYINATDYWLKEFDFIPDVSQNQFRPMIGSGYFFIFNKFNLSGLYAYDFKFSGNRSTQLKFEVSHYFTFNEKNRPLYVRPAVGYESSNFRSNTTIFTPSINVQRKYDLTETSYFAIQEVKSKSIYVGLNFGAHITRTKIIELGINYHFPQNSRAQVVFKKQSNTFFQNILGLNTKSAPIEFPIYNQNPNRFSFTLTYYYL